MALRLPGNEGLDVDRASAPRDNARMAEATGPPRVKLICGVIAAGEEALDAAAERLVGPCGPVERVSEVYPFDLTDYYAAEMGPDLIRRFLSFEGFFDPAALADVKLVTNAIERAIAAEGAEPPRPVNLDPGYIAPAKLVLASMKNFAHRIYLRDGVFAEVTLQWRRGWRALEWTFPDFASGRYDGFLAEVRADLLERGA